MDLIVISDLHLSDGYDKETEKYSRNEDFFFDKEFKRFLRYLEDKNHSNNHLVIAGDFFDFLQVDGHKAQKLSKEQIVPFKVEDIDRKFDVIDKEQKYGLGTEENKTIWKLGVILNGHKVFFQALADFLAEGNLLSIITGNHDIEFYWPKIREKLIDHIVSLRPGLRDKQKTEEDEETEKPEKSKKPKPISFYPWFYYNPHHKTYIEHGNQYDVLNSFEYFLNPLLKHDPSRLWLPFGSLFVRYFFNKLEINNPFADNIKPPTKYMRWAWKEDKWQFLKSIFLYLPTMIRVFLKGRIVQFAKNIFLYIPTRIRGFIKGGKLPKAKNRDLEEANKTEINNLADKCGLLPADVRHIYSLKAPPFTGIKLLNICAFSTFTLIIIALLISIGLFVGLYKYSDFGFLKRSTISLYPFASLIIPAIRWAWRSLRKKHLKGFFDWLREQIQTHLEGRIGKWASKLLQEDILNDALLGIKKQLKKDVQIIVTGHTHDPDVRIFETDESKFKHFNTGTWTTVFSEEERIIREAKQFAFVRIKEGGKESELLRWNDCRNEEERLILFEPKPKKSDKK